MSCKAVVALEALVSLGWCAKLPGAILDTPQQPTLFSSNPCFFSKHTALLLTDGTVIAQGCRRQQLVQLLGQQRQLRERNLVTTRLAATGITVSICFRCTLRRPARIVEEGANLTSFLSEDNTRCVYDPNSKRMDVSARKTRQMDELHWGTLKCYAADGQFMLANAGTEQQALLNAETLTWTSTGGSKADSNNEERWTLLPDKQVLTIGLLGMA